MAAQKTLNLPPIWERSKVKTTKVHVFVNGEPHRPSKEININQKIIRNLDTLLDHMTTLIRPRKGAIRRVFTPKAGHRVNSLEALQNGDKVVAAGHEDFKEHQYGDISYPKKGHRFSYDVEPGHNRRYQVSGRHRKVDTHGTIIRCWVNGVDTQGPKPILLPPFGSRQLSLDLVIQIINSKMKDQFAQCVGRLFLKEGEEVRTIDQIQANGYYVAAGQHEKFKPADYSVAPRPNILTSPRLQRKQLPPLSRSTKASNQSSPEYSISSNNGYRRERAKREEDGVFHARPVKHKRSSEKVRQTDYDQDNGGVFKAKSQNRATKGARQVEESNQTKTELPVDQRQAEEVKEDIKGKGKKDKKGKKQEENGYGSPLRSQDLQRPYHPNARRSDSPVNGGQEAERQAGLKREAEDRRRLEKTRQQQEAMRRKKEEKENKEREEQRKRQEALRRQEEEDERKRQEDARRRREEVEEERRREEENWWRGEEERKAASMPNEYQDGHYGHDTPLQDSPYRSGTELVEDNKREETNNRRRTPTPEKESARGQNSITDQNQDGGQAAEEEVDWGLGLDELKAMEEEERARAATTIQAHYRGMKARQQAVAMRAAKEVKGRTPRQ